MLNHSVIAYDANGRIRNTVSAPTHYSAGVPFNGIRLCLVAGAVSYHHNGQPYVSTHQLAIQSGAPVGFTQGGLGITASGGLAVLANGTITHSNSGLPCTADGRLAIAVAE